MTRIAALTPFYAGFWAAVIGLLPLALAIWIVMRSGWSSRSRVITSVAVPVVTIALFIGLLAVVLLYFNTD